MTYMLWTNNQESNRLTFKKLDKFLKFLERNFSELVEFLIPSTTIFNSYGTVYGNSEFNRHRFVYRPGINDGSEFKIELPKTLEPSINMVRFTTSLSNNIKPQINSNKFSVNVSSKKESNIYISNFSTKLSSKLKPKVNAVKTKTEVHEEVTRENVYVPRENNLTTIVFPD
jgi:hypothetical protein